MDEANFMNIRFRNIAFLLLLTCCTPPVPDFEGVDFTTWKKDRNACDNLRRESVASLIQQKDKLLGIAENDIVELMGRPDAMELYSRSQKLYSYYFLPSPDCSPSAAESDSSRIVLRFTPVGVVAEVTVE